MRRYLGILKSSLLNELYIELEARLLYIFYQSANGAPISREVVQDIRAQRPDLIEYLAQQREVGNIAYLFTETNQTAYPSTITCATFANFRTR